MANLSRLETFVNLGFTQDPFKSSDFETADSIRIGRILKMAVKSRAMISIVGERGMGKTRAVSSALKKISSRQVIVRSTDKSRLLISDIERAMILDLSEESPKRSGEVRARQLRRILGEASQKQSVVVVIEEGHRLHGMTIRALKTLRELDWMGKTELFTVVMLGQSDPTGKAGLSEVRLRSDTVHMQGLTAKEVAEYIRSTVGNVFTEDAISAIVARSETCNFLDLQDILVELMRKALADGRDKVTRETFAPNSPEVSRKPETNGSEALERVLNRLKPEEKLRAVNG
jgi:type II secretory pathway predicted ATPase ExeA